MAMGTLERRGYDNRNIFIYDFEYVRNDNGVYEDVGSIMVWLVMAPVGGRWVVDRVYSNKEGALKRWQEIPGAYVEGMKLYD